MRSTRGRRSARAVDGNGRRRGLGKSPGLLRRQQSLQFPSRSTITLRKGADAHILRPALSGAIHSCAILLPSDGIELAIHATHRLRPDG